MTQPPDDPRRYGAPGEAGHGSPGEAGHGSPGDAGGSSTRKFDEVPPTSAYGHPGYQEPYLAPQFNDPGYSESQYEEYPGQYGQTRYDPQGPGGRSQGQRPGSPDGGRAGGSRGRTVALIALVAVALVVIGVAAALALTAGSDDGDSGGTAAGSSTTTSRGTSASRAPTSTTETSTSTSEAPTSSTTTRTAPSGVTYQITGRGDVVGLNYVDGGRVNIVAATSAPWSQRVSISDGQARLTAVVIRGPLTCTIMYNGETLATQTSNGGLLTCAASVPTEG